MRYMNRSLIGECQEFIIQGYLGYFSLTLSTPEAAVSVIKRQPFAIFSTAVQTSASLLIHRAARVGLVFAELTEIEEASEVEITTVQAPTTPLVYRPPVSAVCIRHQNHLALINSNTLPVHLFSIACLCLGHAGSSVGRDA